MNGVLLLLLSLCRRLALLNLRPTPHNTLDIARFCWAEGGLLTPLSPPHPPRPPGSSLSLFLCKDYREILPKDRRPAQGRPGRFVKLLCVCVCVCSQWPSSTVVNCFKFCPPRLKRNKSNLVDEVELTVRPQKVLCRGKNVGSQLSAFVFWTQPAIIFIPFFTTY